MPRSWVHGFKIAEPPVYFLLQRFGLLHQHYDGDVVEFTWDYDDWYLNIYFIENEWNYQWDFTPDMELELYDT